MSPGNSCQHKLLAFLQSISVVTDSGHAFLNKAFKRIRINQFIEELESVTSGVPGGAGGNSGGQAREETLTVESGGNPVFLWVASVASRPGPSWSLLSRRLT